MKPPVQRPQRNSELLLNHFATARQAGHTTALLKGGENFFCVILARDLKQAQQFRHQTKKAIIVPLCEIDRLAGDRRPLLMDHSVIEQVLAEDQEYIQKLEAIKEDYEYLVDFGDNRKGTRKKTDKKKGKK